MRLEDLFKIRFIDIETASCFPDYQQADETTKSLFSELIHKRPEYKDQIFSLQEEDAVMLQEYFKEAALNASFGRIICISVGRIEQAGEKLAFKVRSFTNSDEKALLTDFFTGIKSWDTGAVGHKIAGHNLINFDIPFICRRAVMLSVYPLPAIISSEGKKPWEMQIADTQNMWGFGQFNARISLKLLCHNLGVPSPKDGIDGSQVSGVYHKEGAEGLKRIAEYCERDVKATANVFLRLNGFTNLLS